MNAGHAMPLFTSNRERRLWLWTLAVVVAIYATLGPARVLVDALRERNLLRVSFGLVVLVVVVAVVRHWVKNWPGWSEVGVALGVALVYGAAFLRMENPAERTHLIEYGIVAVLIHQALLERARNGGSVPKPAALAVALTALLGTLDECIQALLPARVFDVRDIGFNALAGFMAVAARLALAPQRGPGWRLWFWWLMGAAWGGGAGMYARFGQPVGIETLQSSPLVLWAGYLSFAWGAIIVGAVQWVALRRHLARAGRWMLASLGAVGIAGLVILGVGTVDADTAWVVGTGLFGAAAGMLQWLVLRVQVPGAGWWVLASSIGWLVAIPAGEELGWNGLWAVYGVITGTVVVLLLRRTPAGEAEEGTGSGSEHIVETP